MSSRKRSPSARGGQLLVYTDSAFEAVGFVDISDPAAPQAAGVVDLPGEPTSVAVVDDLALVAIDTSAGFTDVSGQVRVIDVHSRETVATIALDAQPDAIDVSPDGHYAAVVLENERDEGLCVSGAARIIAHRGSRRHREDPRPPACESAGTRSHQTAPLPGATPAGAVRRDGVTPR